MDLIWQVIDSLWYLVLTLVPFGVFFYLIESMKKAEKDTKFFKSDFNVEVFIIIINKLLDIFLITGLAALYYSYVLHPLFDNHTFNILGGLPVLIQLPIALILYDGVSYWRHRLLHRYMWSVHAIHHSAEEITWITRHRAHPIEHVISIFMEITVLYFLGVDQEVFIVGALILSIIFYLCHANIDLKYPKPFRYLLISPHFHRWHHANNKEAYDTNFCGTFPFWDLLFGTYYHPEELPEGYGLSEWETKHYSNTITGSLTYPFVRWMTRYKRKKARKATERAKEN